MLWRLDEICNGVVKTRKRQKWVWPFWTDSQRNVHFHTSTFRSFEPKHKLIWNDHMLALLDLELHQKLAKVVFTVCLHLFESVNESLLLHLLLVWFVSTQKHSKQTKIYKNHVRTLPLLIGQKCSEVRKPKQEEMSVCYETWDNDRIHSSHSHHCMSLNHILFHIMWRRRAAFRWLNKRMELILINLKMC